MTKYLVSYYSWSGKTAKVARAIATRLSADLEEIRDAKPRTGLWAYFRSAIESARRKLVAIAPATKDVPAYDVVILGCPVWAGDMASPMRAYITRERPNLKHVALFCTLGGSGAEQTLEKMAALCGRRSVADLGVDAAALKSGAWTAAVEDFARRIEASQPARTGAAA